MFKRLEIDFPEAILGGERSFAGAAYHSEKRTGQKTAKLAHLNGRIAWTEWLGKLNRISYF